MLMSFVVEKRTISYTGYLTQLYFSCFFVIIEGYILTAMACDHYVAICKPGLFHVILSKHICAVFILGAYVMGCWSFLARTLCLAKLTFCNANLVNNYLVISSSCSSFSPPALMTMRLWSLFWLAWTLWYLPVPPLFPTFHHCQHPPHQLHTGQC